MAFSYAGHAVFPSIQASMAEPKDFPSVLNVAYAIVAALSTFLGVAGYYMYGNGALDVVTFNMNAGAPRVCACSSMSSAV
jgi:solute carrier family 32 (vesicular inhibitory amino acid transporter)